MRASLGMIGLALGLFACGATEDGVATQGSGDARKTREEDAGSHDHDAGDEPDAGEPSVNRVLDLRDVARHPDEYTWFDFRPNVKKLILAGSAETEHIAILWYTTQDGGVGLHYHAKTESVYVIDGMQSDAKGDYPTGTVYFNPPGSGHQVTHSAGFFLLAYAAPPDFMNTAAIEEYAPIRIDTTDPELTESAAFEADGGGARVLTPPLDGMGGMRAALIQLSGSASYPFVGNYLLVLRGQCNIDGEQRTEKQLVVGTDVAPRRLAVAAHGGGCLLLGVSF